MAKKIGHEIGHKRDWIRYLGYPRYGLTKSKMGYLRGTKGGQSTQNIVRVYRSPKTLSQEVKSLKRQVALSKNAPHYYRSTTFLASGGPSTWSVNTIELTNNFCSTGTYHDNVTGDEYTNNNLELKVDVKNDVSKCRMVVYVSKNSSVLFTPTADLTGYVTQPDPNSFWVLKDVYLNHQNDVYDTSTTYWVNLRKLVTIYNTAANIIEKGRIRICFIYYDQLTPVANNVIHVGQMLSITDK